MPSDFREINRRLRSALHRRRLVRSGRSLGSDHAEPPAQRGYRLVNVTERKAPATIVEPADERRAIGEHLQGGPTCLVRRNRREKALLVQAGEEVDRLAGPGGLVAEYGGLEGAQQFDRERRPEARPRAAPRPRWRGAVKGRVMASASAGLRRTRRSRRPGMPPGDVAVALRRLGAGLSPVDSSRDLS